MPSFIIQVRQKKKYNDEDLINQFYASTGRKPISSSTFAHSG
jgi:hypothetical protein